MGKYTGKTSRLLCMLALTASFFLVEIIVGYITNSLALVGDSYHMLSDVVALLVGFASVRVRPGCFSRIVPDSGQDCVHVLCAAISGFDLFVDCQMASGYAKEHLWMGSSRSARCSGQRCLSHCTLLHHLRGSTAKNVPRRTHPQSRSHVNCWRCWIAG